MYRLLLVPFLVVACGSSTDSHNRTAHRTFTLINMEGATCQVIPPYNAAPYDKTFNTRGMSEFCQFPIKGWAEAFETFIDNCNEERPQCPEPEPAPVCPTLGLPVCNDELVVSPALPVRPCYDLILRE